MEMIQERKNCVLVAFILGLAMTITFLALGIRMKLLGWPGNPVAWGGSGWKTGAELMRRCGPGLLVFPVVMGVYGSIAKDIESDRIGLALCFVCAILSCASTVMFIYYLFFPY